MSRFAAFVGHALVGWAICGTTIAVARQILSMPNTLLVHAIVAPLVFALLSTITHSIRAGFGGIGRILDPILRVYLSKKFVRAMDDHVRAEFPKLETLLHRGAPWRR